MATTPTQYANAVADLLEQYQAGTINKAAYASALADLVIAYDSIGTLADRLQQVITINESMLDSLHLFGIKGIVTLVSDLPPTATDGAAYIVQQDGHVWTKINGLWTDCGQFKGDKGDDARADLVIQAQYAVAALEPLPLFPVVGAMVFDAAASRAKARTVPADVPTVMTVKKNGAAWATITWPAGNPNGTVTFTGSPTVVAGDLLEPYGPNTFNPAFSSPTIILTGSA